MSEELKTLKDLRIDPNDEYDIIQEQTLRAEAVKWIKQGRRGVKKSCLNENDWIIFFNLTEEELKE